MSKDSATDLRVRAQKEVNFRHEPSNFRWALVLPGKRRNAVELLSRDEWCFRPVCREPFTGVSTFIMSLIQDDGSFAANCLRRKIFCFSWISLIAVRTLCADTGGRVCVSHV